MIKKSIFQGLFYPENPEILRQDIQSYLNKTVTNNKMHQTYGAIIPHAGYIYSGLTAAHSYQYLKSSKANKIIILAPSHHYSFFDFSIGSYHAFQTPLGNVKTATDQINKLINQYHLTCYDIAFQKEHSLEVQLPFIKHIKPNAEIIPIILGNQSPENSLHLANILVQLIDGNWDDYFFVISTDLSHFYPRDIAAIMDTRFFDLVKKLDTKTLFLAMNERTVEACGIGGVMVLMEIAKQQKTGVRFLNYRHSGLTSGDMKEVVGYLAAILEKKY